MQIGLIRIAPTQAIYALGLYVNRDNHFPIQKSRSKIANSAAYFQYAPTQLEFS